MFKYYTNESIRKLVVSFGTLFNDINILQKDKDGNDIKQKVLLTYSPKEKFYKRLTQPSSISDRTRVEISLPQMGFELIDIIYDPTRHLNKTNQKIKTAERLRIGSYTEVPYNFTFGLYIYTRNIEENLEIIEQILPYFAPEFVISLDMSNIHKAIDVPINLTKTVMAQEYEGDFSSRRSIISTLLFTAKSYVYGPVLPIDTVERTYFDYNLPGGITYTDETGYTLGNNDQYQQSYQSISIRK